MIAKTKKGQFQGGTSFVDHLCDLCLVFVMLSRLFIAALYSPEGDRADLVALVCDAYCDFVTFPFGILGQVFFFCCFVLLLYVPVNIYGHYGTVSSPNPTFSWASLNKRLTSTFARN